MSLYVTFCVVERMEPFVCHVYGQATVEGLRTMERDLREEPPDWYEKLGADVMEVDAEARWEPDWYEPNGEAPQLVQRGYWDLDLVATRRLAADPEPRP